MDEQDINGEHQAEPTLALVPKRKRKNKPVLSTHQDTLRRSNMSREETDLATHVEICAIRYQGIEEKFNVIERRLDKVEADISSIKTQVQTGFSDIKLLLEQRNNQRQATIITTLGSIAVAVLGVIGYLITRH
jgi:ActR/RegA family two-component response regulator